MRPRHLAIVLLSPLAVGTAWAQQAPAPPPALPPTEAPAAPETQPTQPSATKLPPVVVEEPSEKPKETKTKPKAETAKGPASPGGPPPTATQLTGTQISATGRAGVLAPETKALDDARNSLLTQVGTNAYSLNQQTLEAMPEGTNAHCSSDSGFVSLPRVAMI